MVHRLFQRHRVDAEAHAVKPKFGHQGNVGVGVTIGVFSRIIMGVLRKPLSDIDAVLQVLGAGERGFHVGGAILCEQRQTQSQQRGA